METNVETNVKVVGFANQSLNGVTLRDEGFDMEYDGKNLNMSGFSGDKLYYAKLNNQQILDMLQKQTSQIPLEQRIMMYREKIPKKTSKRKTVKFIKNSPHHKSIRTYNSRHNRVSTYKSPKMRSEIRHATPYKSKSHTHSKRKSKIASKYKTIY